MTRYSSKAMICLWSNKEINIFFVPSWSCTPNWHSEKEKTKINHPFW